MTSVASISPRPFILSWASARLPVLLVSAILLIGAGYPMALLFLTSIFPEIMGGRFDGFLDAYRRIGETEGIGSMLWNSFAWAAATTVVSWIFGVPCGYLLARTNLPGKLWARLSLLVPIMTPPYIAALSYILVMQDGGFIDQLLGPMPEGLRAWFFSFWGVTLVMALASFGYVALATEAALSAIPRRLEIAAAQLGASWSQTLRVILIPLLLPALFNSGLLVFLEALSNFGVPAVLGTRANLPLLPAEIFYLVTSWPLDLALATALSSLLCLVALIALYGSRLIANFMGNGRYEPETPHQFELGPSLRLLGLAWFGGLFFLSTLLPYFAMIITSVADQWRGTLPSLTLEHYRAILTPGSRGSEALFTSLWLAFAAATISIFLGAWIAYVTSRTRGWLRHALEGLATLPRVIPKIVLAVGLILAWNAFWVPVSPYNTVWMLLLAYVVIYITDALNYSNSRLQSMDPGLEHAASILGASRQRVFLEVVLPQLKPALLAAWLTTFIVTMRELVASILLLPPGVDTSATFIFNQFEQGDLAVAMAMASITIALSSIVLVVFQIRSRQRAPT